MRNGLCQAGGKDVVPFWRSDKNGRVSTNSQQRIAIDFGYAQFKRGTVAVNIISSPFVKFITLLAFIVSTMQIIFMSVLAFSRGW